MLKGLWLGGFSSCSTSGACVSQVVFTESKQQVKSRGDLLAGQEAASNFDTNLSARLLSHQVCLEVTAETAAEILLKEDFGTCEHSLLENPLLNCRVKITETP